MIFLFFFFVFLFLFAVWDLCDGSDKMILQQLQLEAQF